MWEPKIAGRRGFKRENVQRDAFIKFYVQSKIILIRLSVLRLYTPLGTNRKVSLDVGIQMFVSRRNSQEEFSTGNSQEEFSTGGNFQEEFSTEYFFQIALVFSPFFLNFLNFFLEFSKLFQKVLGRQLN